MSMLTHKCEGRKSCWHRMDNPVAGVECMPIHDTAIVMGDENKCTVCSFCDQWVCVLLGAERKFPLRPSQTLQPRRHLFWSLLYLSLLNQVQVSICWLRELDYKVCLFFCIILESELVSGPVVVGVRPSLPVEGISVILGNNLAGGRVWRDISPPAIVTSSPSFDEHSVITVPWSVCVLSLEQRIWKSLSCGYSSEEVVVW